MSTFEELAFYRGFSQHHDISKPTIKNTRKDRRPRDIPDHIHTAADEWFMNSFGIKYRSQSIFVTSDLNIASAYAGSPRHIGRIIPLGPYSYCWSRQIKDMMELFIGANNTNPIHEELNSANYIQTDLMAAHMCGHEVMLFCNSYICIPIDLLDTA